MWKLTNLVKLFENLFCVPQGNMQKAFKIEGKDNPFPSLDHFCL